MNDSSVIVYRKKGKTPADEFLKLCLGNCPTVFGAALAQDGRVDIAMDTDQADDLDKAVDEVKTLMKDNDQDMVMSFQKYPIQAASDDHQPFVLLKNDKDECVLAAFIDGSDFSIKDPESSHSAAFVLAFKYLRNKLFDMYANANQDIGVLMKKLDEDYVKMEFGSAIINRGAITLIAGDGQVKHFCKPDGEVREFTWGTASRTYGYKEAETAVVKTGGKVFGKGRPVASTVAIQQPKPSTPAGTQSVPAVDKKALATSTAVGAVAPTTGKDSVDNQPIIVRVPAGWNAKNHKTQIKKHYKEFTGLTPPNWRDLPNVAITAPLYLKEPGRIPKDLIVSAPAAVLAIEKTSATNAVTGATTDNTIASQTPAASSAAEDARIMSVETIKAVEKILERKDIQELMEQRKLTLKAQGSLEMLFDPKELQDAEDKSPKFTEQTGTELFDYARWSTSQANTLGQASTWALANLFTEWKTFALIQWLKVQEMTKARQTKDEPVPAPAGKRFGQKK